MCPIPGASVAGVGVWTRGGLEDCSWRGLKCTWRVLWEAGGYGSRLVWLPGDGDEEKQPEGIQRVGLVISRLSGEGLVGEAGSP